jgi:hypothetical protein
VLIGYSRGVRQGDLDLIAAVGGQVTRQYPSLNLVAAQLPDGAVSRVRGAKSVSYVEYDATACAQG